MSWHYSQALEAAYSAANFSDGAPYALWKSMPFAPDDSASAKMKATCHRSPFGMMYLPSTDTLGADVLTWFLAGFPVRTFHPQEKAQESAESAADYGARWPVSLAKLDPVSRCWKIPQCSLFEDLEKSLETWPKWGMMQNGECFPLPMLEHDTAANASGSWPTPNKVIVLAPKGVDQREHWKKRRQDFLDGKSKFNPGEKLEVFCNGLPNPTWVEWHMGWPMTWTDLKPLETDKFQQWLRSHGNS